MELKDLEKKYAELGKEIDNLKNDNNKTWVHAFVEYYDNSNCIPSENSESVIIKYCSTCTKYKILLKYILLSIHGGFWFNHDQDEKEYLRFVIDGNNPDPKYSYKHAKEFIEENEPF